MEVDSVLPPKDKVEGGSERVVREGTRSVEAIEGGGVINDEGFGDGRMTVVGRGGGGMILVAFLLLEIVEKGFCLEESSGRRDGVGVIDKCEAG